MQESVLIFSKFPTKEKPAFHTFIKNRVNCVKDLYDITVVHIQINDRFRYHIQEDSTEGYRLINILIPNLKIPKIRALFFEIRIWFEMNKIISQLNPSIIHVHFSKYYSWIISSIAQRKKIPYVVTEHATFLESDLNDPYYKKKIIRAYINASKVIAVSQALKNIILKYVSIEVTLIPNIIDTDLFRPKNSSKKTISEKIMALSIGGFKINDIKGFGSLIKAISADRFIRKNLVLTIIGDGLGKANIISLIDELNLQNTVLIKNAIPNENLPELYNETDFFI